MTSIEHMMQFFEYKHLPQNLAAISADCARLAESMVGQLPHNQELTAGLRKLLEAKDCFVRAHVAETNRLKLEAEKSA